MLKNILVPNFLSNADSKLLLKYPLIWSSKIHYVAWFTLLSWVFLSGVALIIPQSELEFSFLGFYWLLIILCLIAGLIIWFVFLFRHNSSKQYGNRTPGREWVNIACNYLCLVLISSMLFVFPAVSMLKSHLVIREMGFVEKVNTLNINSPFFPTAEYNLQEIYEPMDTNRLVIRGYKLRSGNTYGCNEYKLLDKQYLGYDNFYIEFGKISGKKNIERGVVNYLRTAKEFGIEHPYPVDRIVALIDDTLGYKRDETFEAMNTSLTHSLEEKINPAFNGIDQFDFLLYGMFYYVWFLILIPLVLLIITIFRSTATRFFLISSGVTILLVIVNALLVSLILSSDYQRNQTGNTVFLFIFFSVWALVLLVMSANVFIQKSYRELNAYTVFLFNLLLPLLPWIFTELTFIYMSHKYQYFEMGYNQNVNLQFNQLHEVWSKWMYVAGLVLFFIMQQLYFKKLYERLWALPK